MERNVRGETEFKCTMCFYQSQSYTAFCRHMVQFHKHDSSFIVNCTVSACSFVTRSWPAFKMHIKRKHQSLQESANIDNSSEIELFEPDTSITNEDGNGGSSECPSREDLFSAAYLLSLETVHKLSQKALESVLSTTPDLLNHYIELYRRELIQRFNTSGLNVPQNIFDGIVSMPVFSELNSTHKRYKFYEQHFHFVRPQEVFLGSRIVKHNGKVVLKKMYGYIVPLVQSLESLLSLPDVWNCIQSPHLSCDGFFRDFCDGSYFNSHPLFSKNPRALQIILNTDDIEIVNPIGAHVKKHKLTMFYFTLANTPPKYRSRLKTIQLLAVARTKDIRKFRVEKLLADFITSVTKMASGGIQIQLFGHTELIEGNLLAVVGDTPAAHWLAGFKEGVGFAKKICRTCDASNDHMQNKFVYDHFQYRNYDKHVQRCNDLEKLSKSTFNYWSVQWGINNRSCLMEIPFFDICVCFPQDPMHLLLEGVVPYELNLLLYNCIATERLFSLNWLNTQLSVFEYSYLEVDKPEPFSFKDIEEKRKIKQTASGTLTLCNVLPFILGKKLSRKSVKWQNFLRLLQITFLALSPYATIDTAGQLKQLVATHHSIFKEEYPNATITPKMHYLVHFPTQLLNFGPLRHQWCIRFEAKHAYFKGQKWKCFKNLPKSLALKHQLWMCQQQLGPNGKRNLNYLYEGDLIQEGTVHSFESLFPDLADKFAYLNGTSPDNQIDVYISNCVTIHGIEYRPGCVLVNSCDEFGFPDLLLVKSMVVVDNVKYFVVENLLIEDFNFHIISYEVVNTEKYDVIKHSSLKNRWPLSIHKFEGKSYVLNKYSHICECL